jgi:drug/metabolite transporter (DMT)-like permease
MNHPKDNTRITVALLTVQLLFGIHYLAAKLIVAEIPSPAWATLRVLLSAAVLLTIALIAKRKFPNKRDTLILAGCSLFGVGLNQAFFLEGISRTTGGHAALLNSQIPVFTLIIALLVGQEKLTIKKFISFALGAAGVLILLEVDNFNPDKTMFVGDLFNIANALSFAIFVVISRRVISRNDPLASTTVLFLAGSVWMVAYGGKEMLACDYSILSSTAIWSIVFTVLGATVGTYLLNYWALARTKATHVALYIFLQPVIATILDVVVMKETLGWRFPIATVLVLGALLFINKEARPAETPVTTDRAKVG